MRLRRLVIGLAMAAAAAGVQAGPAAAAPEPAAAMEVGQGNTFLGTTFYVRNSWYVGLPHPSLRCWTC